jgi:putative endonuclease
MDVLRVAKTLLARCAGAPMPAPAVVRRSTPDVTRFGSTLYAVPAAAPTPLPVPRTSRQRSGDDGEAYARRYLECAGLTFVAGNVRYRDGELDLVMRDKPQRRLATPALIFVEVRRRSRDAHGGAAASVTREKRRRLVAAASHYLVGMGLRTLPPVRFDVVTIDGDPVRGWRVAWLRDAFRDEGR